MEVSRFLKFVPDEYMNNDEMPFSLCPETENTYLSRQYPKYPDWKSNPLSRLAINELTPGGFIQDLRTAVLANPVFFQRPPQWHVNLAKKILTLDVFTYSAIYTIPLIPLRGGRWVSGMEQNVFFSDNVGELNIPEGLPLKVVDRTAEASFHRRDLFMRLGVETCQAKTICRLIHGMHIVPDFDPAELSTETLISHAVFLYKASWQPPNRAQMWLVSKSGNRHRGSELYVEDVSGRGSHETIRPLLDLDYPFLHHGYYDAIKVDKKGWISWLCKQFRLSDLPRLVVPSDGSPNFDLSEDFKIVWECDNIGSLRLMRNNWSEYSKWVEEDPFVDTAESRASKARVRKRLSQMPIKCRTGSFQLGKTFLPCVDFDMDELPLPVLNIPDPGDHRWHMLSNFGVSVKKDVHFYLLCLESFEKLNHPTKVMHKLYQKLQGECIGNEELLR
jgi:hypothetical protein